MIVDQLEARAQAVAAALQTIGYVIVGTSSADDFLPKRVSELRPDVVLIHIDAPNRDTLEQIHHVNRKCPLPIVMFSQNDDSNMIARAVRAGVSAYVIDGLQATKVRTVIDVAIAQFGAFQAMRDELERTQSKLSQKNDVDRAKEQLMQTRGLSEPDAHRFLQRQAMNQNRKLSDVAKDYAPAQPPRK